MSFSDPPVSATKEFERDHPDAVKSFKFNRMMRTSRTHSLSNVGSLRLDNGAGDNSDSEEEPEPAKVAAAPLDDNKLIEYLRKKYVELSDEEEMQPQLPAAQVRQLTEVLMHSMKQDKEISLAVSQIRQLTDVLMTSISKNTGAKEEFFGRLMISMPKETLHWAVKENSSYQYLNEVKEQVGASTMTNYLINMMKTDDDLAQKIARDMRNKMNPEQKLKFISMLVQDQAVEPKDS